jgi:hypothetical protein
MNNNNRRRNFRGRQQKNNFRRRPSSNHGTNGHFSSNGGNRNFSRNGSLTNPLSIEKVIFKYQQLAKDAQSSGDPVLIENYLQHAEHYSRKLAEMNLKSQSTIDKTVKNENLNLDTESSKDNKI